MIHKIHVCAASAVRFDERPCQLLSDVLAPLPVQPGKVAKEDNDRGAGAIRQKGNGGGALSVRWLRPPGWTQANAMCKCVNDELNGIMLNLCNNCGPIIILMWLNCTCYRIRAPAPRLNTHQAGSFYDRFVVETAHELANRFIWHYTPKHASWLNMAEIEFAALSKQCLDRRIGDLATLEKEVLAWVEERNREAVKINWLFDTAQARKKLKRHYVKINSENNTTIDSAN